MKKLMIAAVGAVAVGFSAVAADWFNGGIGDLWPTNSTMTGGTWSNVSNMTYDAELGGVEITAPTNAPLTFAATKAKTISDIESATVTSEMTFTPFPIDELETLPVPEGAKAGVILVKDGETLKYYGLHSPDEGAAMEWTDLGLTAEASGVPVTVSITVNPDGTGSYAISGTVGQSFYWESEDDTLSTTCYVGDGTLSSLSATVAGEAAGVTFTIAAVANATFEVDGAELVEGNTYTAEDGATVTVTYTAGDGFLFKDGTKTLVVEGTASEGGTISTTETTLASAAKIGDVEYLTLQAAVNVGGEVKVLTDLSESITNAAGNTVTLDLNGKTLQNSKAYYTIDNAGVLTVVDSAETAGTITHLTADTSSTIRNLGTLTISDITVGGTYIGIKNDEGAGCNGGKGYGELTLYGVTFNGDDQAVQNWGVATINGGIFNGKVFTWADEANTGNVAGQTTINGGVFSNKVAAVQTYRDSAWPTAKATVTVNGGTFEEKVYGTYTTNYEGEEPEIGVIAVPTASTAQFKIAPAVTLSEGYKFKLVDGYYVVAAIDYATLTVTQVDNCTIVVSNDTAAVASGAKFDKDDEVDLTVYRTPAEGYDLDGCEAVETITMTNDVTVTAAVKQQQGGAIIVDPTTGEQTEVKIEDIGTNVTTAASAIIPQAAEQQLTQDSTTGAYTLTVGDKSTTFPAYYDVSVDSSYVGGTKYDVAISTNEVRNGTAIAADEKTPAIEIKVNETTSAQEFKVNVPEAKDGLYYGLEYANNLQFTDSTKVWDKTGTVLTAPASGNGMFYRVVVTDVEPEEPLTE